MNNCAGSERLTAIRFYPYGIFPLKKSAGKLFSLTLIILTLSLIISPANSQVNINDGLVQAAYKGEIRKIRSLIAKGADIHQTDHKGKTALIASSTQGHLDIVEILLSKGADVNFQPKKGLNSLMLSSLKGHKEIVDALLAKGADVNFEAKGGFTALTFSSLHGHKEIVNALLINGAKVDHQARDNWTALLRVRKLIIKQRKAIQP